MLSLISELMWRKIKPLEKIVWRQIIFDTTLRYSYLYEHLRSLLEAKHIKPRNNCLIYIYDKKTHWYDREFAHEASTVE